jgi:hypothetical protein
MVRWYLRPHYGFYRVLPGSTGFYKVRFYEVLRGSGSTRFCTEAWERYRAN